MLREATTNIDTLTVDLFSLMRLNLVHKCFQAIRYYLKKDLSFKLPKFSINILEYDFENYLEENKTSKESLSMISFHNH